MLPLRHQLRVIECKVDKPAWQAGDRILLAALSRLVATSGLPSLLLMAYRPVAAELEHKGGVLDASTTNPGLTFGSPQQQSGRVKAGDLWAGLNRAAG